VTTDYAALLRALAAGRVEFIIVGGLAATIHGAARATYDVDVVYARTPANLSRIVAALAPLRPYLRGAPAGLPFTWNVDTLSKGLNFTLTTTLGDLDLLGEITYGGTYDALLSDTEVVTVLGIECRCLSLEQLIQVKRAAGRVKDLEALAELEAIAEERRR
jgi:predicted nucleotidyltransferase